MTLTRLLWMGGLLGAVVVSGIQVAHYSQLVRELHGQLQAAQLQQDAQLAEHSRLLLERSVEASYQNVEHIAESDLAMIFPDRVEHLQP